MSNQFFFIVLRIEKLGTSVYEWVAEADVSGPPALDSSSGTSLRIVCGKPLVSSAGPTEWSSATTALRGYVCRRRRGRAPQRVRRQRRRS